VEDVYEGCFLNYPNDVAHRNHYVYLALVTRHYATATRQIEILGDKSEWRFTPADHSRGDGQNRRENPGRPTVTRAPASTRPAASRPVLTPPAK
jgi:hypothetical protein